MAPLVRSPPTTDLLHSLRPLRSKQTNTPSPVQTAAWANRATGAPVVPVGAHVSLAKLYRPPVLNGTKFASQPPQTIISVPVQTAVW